MGRELLTRIIVRADLAVAQVPLLCIVLIGAAVLGRVIGDLHRAVIQHGLLEVADRRVEVDDLCVHIVILKTRVRRIDRCHGGEQRRLILRRKVLFVRRLRADRKPGFEDRTAERLGRVRDIERVAAVVQKVVGCDEAVIARAGRVRVIALAAEPDEIVFVKVDLAESRVTLFDGVRLHHRGRGVRPAGTASLILHRRDVAEVAGVIGRREGLRRLRGRAHPGGAGLSQRRSVLIDPVAVDIAGRARFGLDIVAVPAGLVLIVEGGKPEALRQRRTHVLCFSDNFRLRRGKRGRTAGQYQKDRQDQG